MAMITLPRTQEPRLLADARHLTVWQAMCLHRDCQNRRRGAVGLEEHPVTRWACDHAADLAVMGGHTVAVWCVIAGQHRWRPLLIRCNTAGAQPSWQWLCLLPHEGQQWAAWMPGQCSPGLARQAWLDHNCSMRGTK